jgi:hypothetical protein
VKSYTVTLSSSPSNGAPQILDHYFYYDPLSGANFVYPLTADGGPASDGFNTSNYTVTANDGAFAPWGYLIQDYIKNISVGPLKGPYTINFDPSMLDQTASSTLKIVYNFGDNTPDVTVSSEIIPQYTLGQAESAVGANATIVSHDYYPQSNSGITIYTPSITAYNSNIVRNIFNITISSTPASIYDFDDIHLINNTQQLTSIETQNIFEVDNPDYLTVARILSSVDTAYPTVIPFDPNTSVLSYDLITWLDASDATTIAKNNDGKVLVWYDKSAYKNNYFCELGGGANAPAFLYPRQSQSGRKCVHFTADLSNPANSQYLYAIADRNLGDKILYTYGKGFTIIAVMKLNAIGSKDTLFAYDLNTNEVGYQNSLAQLAAGNDQNYLPFVNVSFTNNNSITVEQGDTSYYFGTSAYDPNNGIYQPTNTGIISQNLTNYSLFTTTISGNQNAFAYITADTAIIQRENQNYQNYYTTLSGFLSGGYNQATGATILPGQYDYSLVYGLLGTSDAYFNSYLTDAEISEFMLFDRPLNPDQIASVQAYLINKWGLTLQTN